jgi:hypothetical protein
MMATPVDNNVQSGKAAAAVETRRPRKTGPIAAALLGLAAGQFAMGVFSLLDQWLNPTEWIPPNGQEGGVKMVLMWSNYAVMTGLLCQTVIVWLVTWAIANEALGAEREVRQRVWWSAGILMGLGLLFAFTPFYNWLLPG